ncbi:hypothetical protein Srot_2887 [Segniliparus rotundus DSM 44985]|uniref:PknH-like extracellular domain-containing protein n=1 Tax=Segniliparus rotundus (strain ATCC BAA-972 / CDC 1076 / CIP 108378 / DSM 44985 / JCM 13578) TaxID=640132 RepID=D6ZDR1_SEGRD|nr:sensor domain-containing protein [Segniliparus rotundus]ADG99318.1 hypothetical protein Srot_2887 [Segniliparus rotundus DSM 44985]
MLRTLCRVAARTPGRRFGPCLAVLSLALVFAGCDAGRRVLPPLPQPTAEPIEGPPLVSSSPAQAAVLPATAVGRVPLSLDEVNRLAGKGLYKSGDAPLSAPADAKGTAQPQECLPVLSALRTKAVSGTAFSAFQFVVFPAADASGGVFEQAAAVYPDVAPAKTVFQKVADALGSCDGKSVDERQDEASQPITYDIRSEESEDGALRWTEQQQGQAGGACVFEVRRIKNLVFEVVECGDEAGDLAAKAAAMLASRAV